VSAHPQQYENNKITMKKLLLPLLTTLLLSSCTLLEEVSVLKVTMNGKPIPATITFSHTKGAQITIDINSPTPWKIEDYPNWLSFDQLIAEGAAKVTITVFYANEFHLPRNGEIIFLAANGDKLIIKVSQNPDPVAVFMFDVTPRWESGTTVENNTNSLHTFITDKGGNLFASSPTYKTGRITTADGSNYEIIEFPAPPVVGTVSGAKISKPSGSVPLHSLKIVKKEGDKLWLIFYETPTSPERRVVQ